MGWYVIEPGVAGTDVRDSQAVDDELRELERPLRNAVRVGGVLEHVGADVRDARPRRGDDRVEACEDLDEARGERPRDIRVPRVQVQLSATGLCAREGDLDAQSLEQGHRRAADRRIERVGQAGDEQRDAHRASVIDHRSFEHGRHGAVARLPR